MEGVEGTRGAQKRYGESGEDRSRSEWGSGNDKSPVSEVTVDDPMNGKLFRRFYSFLKSLTNTKNI